MTMAEKLCDLRKMIPGCHVAAYIDLSSKIVLLHDARSKTPQERLDGLADRAARLLGTPGVLQSPLTQTAALSADNVEVFLRIDPSSADSLALVCNVETDVEDAAQQGLGLLKEMAPHA